MSQRKTWAAVSLLGLISFAIGVAVSMEGTREIQFIIYRGVFFVVLAVVLMLTGFWAVSLVRSGHEFKELIPQISLRFIIAFGLLIFLSGWVRSGRLSYLFAAVVPYAVGIYLVVLIAGGLIRRLHR